MTKTGDLMQYKTKTGNVHRLLKASVLAAAIAMVSPVLAASPAEEPTWKINMKEAEIRQLIEQVADITGDSFVVDPRVKGKVTVISDTNMNQQAILQMFESVLKVHNFSSVRTGSMVKIVPTQGAKQDSVPLEAPDGASDKIITQVIPVTYASATELVPILRPLIPQYGHLAAVTSSNALIISDHSVNVQRMVDIVKRIDKDSDEEVQVVQLKNAWVGDLVKVLEQVTGAAAKGGAQPGGSPGGVSSRVRVIADERANRLIIKGEKSARQKIQVLVADLDRPTEHSVSTSVMYLKYADAVQVAEVLRGIITGQTGGGMGGMAGGFRGAGGMQGGFGASGFGSTGMGSSGSSFGSSGFGSGGFGSSGMGGSSMGGTMGGFGDRQQGGTSAPIQAGNVTIQADDSLNALIVRAGPSEMAEISKLIKDLDIRRAQVLIEAAIVEIRGDSGEALGAQWARVKQGVPGGINFANAGLGLQNVLALAQGGEAAANVKLSNGLLLTGGNNYSPGKPAVNEELDADGNVVVEGRDAEPAELSWGLIIQAINTASNTNLLSTPSLMTMDNQEAEILVGQNVPFLVGSQQTSTGNPFNTVERKDVGISLKVLPQINEGDTIRLRVMQEASSLASTANVQATDVITNKRMINTSILAKDGQVIVLGGLMADTVIDTVQKVPLLGDIPILGALFRSHSTTQEKSNLLLFLRPTVVRDDATVASVTDRKYQTMRNYRSRGEGEEMVLDTRNLLDEDPGKVLESGVTLPSKVSD